MSTTAATILAHLKTVDAERAKRAEVPGLSDRVVAVKAYQQRRFSHTYADLLGSARYGPASRFFLDELYGPGDFTSRDTQFARVVPALVRLFPGEIVDTVATLAELHALSEILDTVMGNQIADEFITGIDYIGAWQRTDRSAQRQRQIDLTLEVASRLDRFTRRALLRNSLRLMRAPARAAGLTELQRFLEAGFDTFREMHGSREFISIVEARERVLASELFGADVSDASSESVQRALRGLPT
ncbi:MAG TPA: hypothetical protein VNU48_00570 [Burkholderiaceae bacterium]|nr:hypothetical protein [Burkholderiaceae bacterium]